MILVTLQRMAIIGAAAWLLISMDYQMAAAWLIIIGAIVLPLLPMPARRWRLPFLGRRRRRR